MLKDACRNKLSKQQLFKTERNEKNVLKSNVGAGAGFGGNRNPSLCCRRGANQQGLAERRHTHLW